jgi:hypothetical protein
MKLSGEDLKALHQSWQEVLDAEMRLGKARAQAKIEEGTAELAKQVHNELVARLLVKAGARPLAHVIDMETGEIARAPSPPAKVGT